MQALVNSYVLAEQLRILSKIVANKVTLPILGHVLIRATDEHLVFYTTDFEIGIHATCKSTTIVKGVITLPIKKLLEIVNQFPDADVTIELDKKQHVIVSCGTFKTRLQTMDADLFPPIPSENVDRSFELPALQSMIAQVRYAIHERSQNYFMNGALLAIKGDSFALVATDGRRLAMCTAPHTNNKDYQMIIPSKTLDILSVMQSLPTSIAVSDRHLFFQIGAYRIISRMIDAKFPAYERIVPRTNQHVAGIDTATMQAALRRVSAVAGDTQAVHMHLTPNTLRLSAVSADVGDAVESFSILYDGPELLVTLNYKHVLDFLDAADDDSFQLALKDDKTPALFLDGDNYLNVIMLMRS
jgi:DNA polymerase-3 subunit beta